MARPTTSLAILLIATSFAGPATAGIDPRIICQPCETAEQCGDHTDLCLIYPGVGNFCGMHCLTDEDCYGLSCEPTEFEGISNCVDIVSYCRLGPPIDCGAPGHCDPGQDCVDGRCVDAGVGLGEVCEADDECGEGRCRDTQAGRICTVACDWLEPLGGGCPDGFVCDEADGCGDGVCVPGAAGEAARGETCVTDGDCAGLLCADFGAGEAICSEPCDPAILGCGDGAHCQARGDGCGGCIEDCVAGGCGPFEVCIDGACERLREDGEACAEPRECSSGLCRSGVCGEGSADGGPAPPDDGGLGAGHLESGCECLAAPGREPGGALARLLGSR